MLKDSRLTSFIVAHEFIIKNDTCTCILEYDNKSTIEITKKKIHLLTCIELK